LGDSNPTSSALYDFSTVVVYNIKKGLVSLLHDKETPVGSQDEVGWGKNCIMVKQELGFAFSSKRNL
jgi:hypothetical protein